MMRHPLPCEAEWLTDLAMRSKAWWGYDASFMQACRQELTTTVGQIEQELTWVLVCDETVVGFHRLSPQTAHMVMLDMLFVDPPHMGKGYGKTLLQHAIAKARHKGFQELQVVSDPCALAFYEHMGAEQFDRAPSGSIAGRWLPKLRFLLTLP